MDKNREQFASRLSFILISAACAIGVGNVWKFPWMVGEYGGGAFVLVYLIFLVILGIPAMTVEFAIGRAAKVSPVKMYQKLTPNKKEWHIHGMICLIGNIVLMMFYTVVAGWMLYYFVNTANGNLIGLSSGLVEQEFGKLCQSPVDMIFYMIIITVLGFFVLSFSLKTGLEKVNKYIMLTLFFIIIVLALHSMSLSGASEGLKFYLYPDFSKINMQVIVMAMNQAFFTLSLGIGALAIFGSYIDKKRTLLSESINIVILDTLVAIISGLIIFPACFTYKIHPNSGPSLIFITLPNIFSNLRNGRIWGSLFFLFMTFASFTTVLAVFENILACIRDLTKWDRKKASIICCISIIILSCPCALGFNAWSFIEPLGSGTGIMDVEDFIVSNCLLPLGSLIFVLYCTRDSGFGFKKFLSEANAGKGLKLSPSLEVYMKYILPLIIIVVFLLGIKQYVETKDLFMISLMIIISYIISSKKKTV